MKKGAYIFNSKRLGFSSWTKEDLEEFAKLNADEEVMEHFPKTLSEKEVTELIEKLIRHYAENGFTYYATEILETKEFIGMIGLAFQQYKTAFTPAIDIGWRLKNTSDDALSFLRQPEIFGDLIDNQRFTKTYTEMIEVIYREKDVRMLMSEML